MKKLFVIFNLVFAFLLVQSLDFDCNKSFAKKHNKKEQEKKLYMQEMGESMPKKDVDYEKIFKSLSPIQVQFIHDEDPDEYYDTQKIYFSPYPLIRLTQPLYFLDKKIEHGFYLLTPREYNGQKCVLFKQAGKIKYVVPVFEFKSVNPELEYHKPPKKWYEVRDRYVFKTQYYERKVRAFDVYSEYYEIDLYYNDGLSKMIFKKNPY